MNKSLEQINGQIERVTFHSEETGFCVVRLNEKGHRDRVTVIGTVPQVTPGEWLAAEGDWVVDPKHGRQFKAESIRLTHPDTLEGIEKYLGSGLIKGIGPVYAAKLVRKFGRKIFDVMEHNSKTLEKVEGIGPTRRKVIKAAWEEQKVVREIMTFLLSHGVSTTRAFRIYKTYGENAVGAVQRNPYRLARDIPGIGFLTADRIAMSTGVDQESPMRAQAGVEYALFELTSEGHCAFPRERLIDKTVSLLEIPAGVVAEAIDRAKEERRLVEEEDPAGRPLIYLIALYQAECALARSLIALMHGAHPCPDLDREKAMAWAEKKLRIALSPAQRSALKEAFSAKVMVITGGPGVGKTTLISAILKIFRAKKLQVCLCAPTGRAAKRMSESTGMGAKTIHRLLVFDPKQGGFKHDADHPIPGDVFIVDETSMIDLMLAHNLIQAIPSHAAVILLGDVDQLPSVGPGNVLKDIIQSGRIQVHTLHEIFRQASESAIVTNAHRVNRGRFPYFPQPKEASDFYFAEAEEPEKACRVLVKMIRESIPQRFGFNALDEIQVITPMQRGELGARNLNQLLQNTMNPGAIGIEKYGTEYRSGDKVMQIVNNYEKDVFNGDIGRISRVSLEERQLQVSFDERTVPYRFQELDELILAYATTIHKSQGSEYPCVVIPLHTQHYLLLQRNLLYTAITRGRKLVVLVGSEKAVAIAVKKAESGKRITTLQERLVTISSDNLETAVRSGESYESFGPEDVTKKPRRTLRVRLRFL